MEVDDEQPSLTNYVFSLGTYGINLSAGQAALQNFTAILATNHITGRLEGSDGIPITNVTVYAYANIGGKGYGISTDTDASGDYSLNVANGNWGVGVCCDFDGWPSDYCCLPGNQYVSISKADGVVNFTVPGLIATPSPLPEGYVGYSYLFRLATAACASNPNWSATNLPSGLTLLSDGTLYGVPDTIGSNYFSVHVTDGSRAAD